MLMGWYSDHVLPKLLDLAMDTQHIRRIRARVTAGLAGEVVEVGFGTGHNPAYLPAIGGVHLAAGPSRPAFGDQRVESFGQVGGTAGSDTGVEARRRGDVSVPEMRLDVLDEGPASTNGDAQVVARRSCGVMFNPARATAGSQASRRKFPYRR